MGRNLVLKLDLEHLIFTLGLIRLDRMDHGRVPLNDAEPLPIMDSFHRLLLRGENTLILGLGRKSAVGCEQTDNEKHRVCLYWRACLQNMSFDYIVPHITFGEGPYKFLVIW